MKTPFFLILICISLFANATPADSLKKRKHFAIEGDIAYATARINPVIPWFTNVIKADLKAEDFMTYNLAFVYDCRGINRDCSDPVHDLSFLGGASFMKMNIEQIMENYRFTKSDTYSDVSFGTQKVNFTYSPIEISLLFRYTYSTRKYFASFNAGVSRVFVNDSKYTPIQYTRNNFTASSTETINSTTNVDHYLVPNNSTNNILGLRLGYNGKKFTPFINFQRHGATRYAYFKAGIGVMYYF